MKNIRLSDAQICTICTSFRDYFLKNDQLWLFGSRIDQKKHGGDIDLYIETNLKNIDAIAQARDQFYTNLMMKLGEQKIDIVIKFDDTDLLVYQLAKKNGVQLV